MRDRQLAPTRSRCGPEDQRDFFCGEGEMKPRATPRETLAAVLEYRGRDALEGLATEAGVPFAAASNAWHARPVNTVQFLRLCIALGLNPMPEIATTMPGKPADLDRSLLGAGLKIRRGLNDHSLRDAADSVGVAHSTIRRMEAGDAVSIAAVLGACRYVGVHPFGYLQRENVSRESTVTARRGDDSRVVAAAAARE
jgi:hypothetical protein